MRMHLAQSAGHRRRGGAVIIVVLSLMTTLVFLGLFFFGWSSQEVANAELFAAPDDEKLPLIDPIPHLDRAAEQLIVGTRYGYEASALWGGMHSMLAHTIGRITPELKPTDTNVATGTGIIMRYKDVDNDGKPDIAFDSNGDLADPDSILFIYPDPDNGDIARPLNDLVLNYSPLAQPDPSRDAFNQPDIAERIPYFQPDVDYTYPDINSLFLAHEETVPSDPANPDSDKRRVLIPSFFRPQLFLKLRNENSFEPLYTDSSYRRQTLAPHREHRYANGDYRYIQTDNTPAQSGDKNRMLRRFPFPSNGEMGIFTNLNPSAETLEPDAETPFDVDLYTFLNVDLDGDNKNDSILIDLGLPMLTLSGGQQFVPLASFKVIDADGLLNLNAHGNIQGAQHLGRTENSDDPVSVSNLGMSRSEVNPVWALNGDITKLEKLSPEEALKHIEDRFGPAGIAAATAPHKLGNMELFMLLTGWQPSTNSEATAGRHGDTAQVEQNYPALAGAPQQDDDRDGIGYSTAFGQPGTSEKLPSLQIPGFVHPLAPTGLGLPGYSLALSTSSSDPSPFFLSFAPGAGATRTLGTPLENNPAAFPYYRDFQELTGSRLLNAIPELLDRIGIGNELMDEEDETILEPGHLEYSLHDLPFSASENAALHLSTEDLKKQPVSSRAKTLAAVNFQHLESSDEIRKRFTTDSWDRLEFNYTARASRPWELGDPKPINIDDDWPEGNGQYTFPPYLNVPEQNQPFRSELRKLMRTALEAQSAPSTNPFGVTRVTPRHKLNLNGILSNDPGGPAFENGNPRFRPLIPHPSIFDGGNPDTLATEMYHGQGTPPVDFSAITSDPYAQEWWARYDRQRLARDIYCLLWAVGFADDPSTMDPAERDRQAREMAQFAVNVIDAMDPDNVISEFQYDPNLLDGWDTSPSNLSVVYGVEHQELTFSEVFFIRTAYQDEDVPITEVNENYEGSNGEETRKYHSFIELRNAAPWNVPIENGTWRIRRIKRSDPNVTLFSAKLKDTVKGAIRAGGDYLIGCQDGSNKFTDGPENGQCRPSDFRVDIDGDGDTFELIIPNIAENGDPPNADSPRDPYCDLDLMYQSHASRYESETGPVSEANSLLNHYNDDDDNKVLLILERRLNPDLNTNDNALNPWVEVDRIEGTIKDFDSTIERLGESDFCSQERREPFHPGKVGDPYSLEPEEYNGSASATAGRHTMPLLEKGGEERRNSVSPSKFTLWQPHFDRNFSSVMELLSIPLYGYRISEGGNAWDAQANGGPVRNISHPTDTSKISGHRTAGIRFLYPQGPDQPEMPLPSWLPAMSGSATHYENRWYRLLEFLEVKSQDQLSSDAITSVQRRTPGKINLNTVRDEHVFAGLIDDPFHLNPIGTPQHPTMDRLEGNNRWWYREHRILRDGYDPILAGTGVGSILIPGNLNSRPFRSLSFLDQMVASGSPSTSALSIESTILRRRDLRTSPASTYTDPVAHGLFDAQTSTSLGDFEIDYHTKNRILAKIHNNSTTRSHVFFAWIGIQFFEAHVNENNLIQIGDKSPDLPDLYRMFCVIDMSRIEEAYNPETGTFDFRKFIIYRQLLP